MNSDQNINIEIVSEEQQEVLKNIVSLYLHDLSQYADDLQINKNGLFIYEGIELYFKQPDLLPYFIKLENNIIGFILVNMGRYVPKDVDLSVHEFFILKSYRRKGFGKRAIQVLFKCHVGTYKIEQIANNLPAVKFWSNLYSQLQIEYTESQELLDDIPGVSQVFKIGS
ncbi:GNAT family N-acetyltransferase [Clostridium sp. 'deep sea']|uniref:GNAT family N-acetyltransferase n=1 Tax=Clostridium sp. 'deep sea' TaxID=2779445 RepID=UPI001896992A|nr:GNAT family N-acetyltransferase [Clostridium sp. 'deep sea']QOR36785.1 GNAT family N-acetyltransferase [Clostridium sp. 'deep sea']